MEKRYTIGVMIGNANSPHTMNLMQGIFHAAKSMDVNVLFFLGFTVVITINLILAKIRKMIMIISSIVYDYQAFADADALIIAYGSLCIFLDEKERKTFLDKYKDKPCVLVEERDHSGKATSIIADNYHGMYAVAEHLVRDHGYRRFTYLAGPHGNTDANERRQAVFDVMNAYKVSFDESRVAYGDFSSCVQQQVISCWTIFRTWKQ